jgi:hypothetical protein
VIPTLRRRGPRAREPAIPGPARRLSAAAAAAAAAASAPPCGPRPRSALASPGPAPTPPLPPRRRPQDDPKFKRGQRIKKPETRLRFFVAACGGKRVDESTGNPQPAYRLDKMKIMMEFAKPKAASAEATDQQADVGERKQVRRRARGGPGGAGATAGPRAPAAAALRAWRLLLRCAAARPRCAQLTAAPARRPPAALLLRS